MSFVIKISLTLAVIIFLSGCVNIGPLHTSDGVENLSSKDLILLSEIGLDSMGYNVGVIDGEISNLLTDAVRKYTVDKNIKNGSLSDVELFKELYSSTDYESPITTRSVAAIRLCMHLGPKNVRIYLDNLRDMHCLVIGDNLYSDKTYEIFRQRICVQGYPKELHRFIKCDLIFDGKKFIWDKLSTDLFDIFSYVHPIKITNISEKSKRQKIEDAYAISLNTYDILFDQRRFYPNKNSISVELSDGTLVCKGHAVHDPMMSEIVERRFVVECGGGQILEGKLKLVGFHADKKWMVTAWEGKLESSNGDYLIIQPNGPILH